jgi:hypothetical protein
VVRLATAWIAAPWHRLVRSADQNHGQAIRVLGPRRIVMVFDPVQDDNDL